MHCRLYPEAIDPATALERDRMVGAAICRVDDYRLRM
jgi:hypothetical protein